jgi:hypothetical protein
VQARQISEWFVQLSNEHQSLARSFFSWKFIYCCSMAGRFMDQWRMPCAILIWSAQVYSWSHNIILDYSLALTDA